MAIPPVLPLDLLAGRIHNPGRLSDSGPIKILILLGSSHVPVAQEQYPHRDDYYEDFFVCYCLHGLTPFIDGSLFSH